LRPSNCVRDAWEELVVSNSTQGFDPFLRPLRTFLVATNLRLNTTQDILVAFFRIGRSSGSYGCVGLGGRPGAVSVALASNTSAYIAIHIVKLVRVGFFQMTV
jgi:hypothetical protein